MSENFKNELIEYNKLFDEYRTINFKYAKLYGEEAQPILKKLNEITENNKTNYSSIIDTLDNFNKLIDISECSSFKNFCELPQVASDNYYTEQIGSKVSVDLGESEELFSGTTFGKIDAKGNKTYYLNQLDRGRDVLLAIKKEHPSNEVDEALDAYKIYRDKILKYKRTFWLFRGSGFGVYGVGGFISAVALFSLIIYHELPTTIACAILLVIFGGAMITRFIYNRFFLPKKEKQNISIEKEFLTKIDSYVDFALNELTKYRNNQYIKLVSLMDKSDAELKSVGDKWQAKLDNDTKDITDKMKSFEVIDKSIKFLVENYGNEIHYSKDYMDLFEKNMFIDINSKDAFLNAVRVLIKNKKAEEKEKKLQEERDKENAEKLQREIEERSYQKHIQEETIREQKKQTEIMLQQQKSSKSAAKSLCWSCKFRNGCSLKNQLSSPVCSKYQNRY